MKSLISALFAACAVILGASSAQAGYSGYYLATFTYPGGTFQHCLQLTQTQQYQGYSHSGTWVDTDFADTAGTWVVYKHVLHLAGYVGGTTYLTIDGTVSSGQLSNATFDYFDGSGIYFAAGSLTEEGNSSCGSTTRRRG